MPLSVAVTALNEKLEAYPFQENRFRTRPLSADECPDPVTVEEIVTAIRSWDRKAHPIDDAEHTVFERIAITKTLPAKAGLKFRVQWSPEHESSDLEQRVLRIAMDVMTGENTGYTFVVRKQILDTRKRLKLSRGYEWLVDPMPARPTNASIGGVVFTILDDPDSNFHVIASVLTILAKDIRGVVFDSSGTRHEMNVQRVGRADNLLMLRFLLDADMPDGIKYFGIEGLTSAGEQALSDVAVREAARRNWNVLPLPVIDKKYKYRLSATTGKVIASSDLIGKVVIIDCWATWCGPCLRQVPELVELQKQFTSEDLRIVGVSLDRNPNDAEDFYATKSIDWPLITIPNDDEARALWNDASRITSIPRILVIDKSGVLRLDVDELPTDQIKALLSMDM